MKIYTNSKGESLPKVICAVVDFEKARLEVESANYDKTLFGAFVWDESNIFSDSNYEKWETIWRCNYDHFYSIFPTCKNSRGQELPEEIQVEIVEERLRQWGKCEDSIWKFSFLHSAKGHEYWLSINNETDYTPTELPTKSDDTFTQGEIVEVSDDGFFSSYELEFVFYDKKTNYYVCRSGQKPDYNYTGYLFCRKIQPLELTLPELLTIAEEVKRTKVKLKS